MMNPFLLFWCLNELYKSIYEGDKNTSTVESKELEKRLNDFYKTFER